MLSLVLIGSILYFSSLGGMPDARSIAVAEYEANRPVFNDGLQEPAGFRSPLAEPLSWLESHEPARLAEAAQRLAIVAEGDPSYRQAQYYLGHAFFMQGHYGEAAAQFARILPQFREGSRLQQECQYYLLLSRMAAGAAREEYQPLLEQILADPEHIYYAKVNALVVQLAE